MDSGIERYREAFEAGRLDPSRHIHQKASVTRVEELPESDRPVWVGYDGEGVAPNVREFVDKACVAIYNGRVQDAELLFRKAMEFEEHPTLINNLGLIQLEYRRQPAEALRLLRKNLDRPDLSPQPYTEALAARCYAQLDEPDEARRCLQRAIRDFETGLSAHVGKSPQQRDAWRAYTAKILEAAGEIGEHRKAWELYQRWARHHVMASSHYRGGAAAFNSKRFRSARVAWRRARKAGLGSTMNRYIAVAEWCERGLVEPFTLEYGDERPEFPQDLIANVFERRPRPIEDGREDATDTAARRAAAAAFRPLFANYIERPANRVFMVWLTLHSLMDGSDDEEKRLGMIDGVVNLSASGGDWGEAFAERLLLAPRISVDAKLAAATGLQFAGRLGPDEKVRMWLDGKVREIPLGPMGRDVDR